MIERTRAFDIAPPLPLISMRRARIVERSLVCGGAAVVVGSLFLPWYWRSVGLVEAKDVAMSGWAGESSFDLVVTVLAAAAVAVTWLVPEHYSSRRGALVTLLGGIVGGIVVVRLVDPPQWPGHVYYAAWGLFIAFIGAALLVAGGLSPSRAGAPPPPPRYSGRMLGR